MNAIYMLATASQGSQFQLQFQVSLSSSPAVALSFREGVPTGARGPCLRRYAGREEGLRAHTPGKGKFKRTLSLRLLA